MITMTTAMITNGITPGPSSVTLAGCDTRIVGNFLEGFGNVSKLENYIINEKIHDYIFMRVIEAFDQSQ